MVRPVVVEADFHRLDRQIIEILLRIRIREVDRRSVDRSRGRLIRSALKLDQVIAAVAVRVRVGVDRDYIFVRIVKHIHECEGEFIRHQFDLAVLIDDPQLFIAGIAAAGRLIADPVLRDRERSAGLVLLIPDAERRGTFYAAAGLSEGGSDLLKNSIVLFPGGLVAAVADGGSCPAGHRCAGREKQGADQENRAGPYQPVHGIPPVEFSGVTVPEKETCRRKDKLFLSFYHAHSEDN